MTFVPYALFLSAGLAAWCAWRTRGARAVPGGEAFFWLMCAVAVWSVTSALHGLASTLAAKIVWAQLQYGAIVSVPPLWFMFAGDYADVDWTLRRRVRAALWVIPVLTVLAALTNDWHRAMWPAITLQPNGLVVYGHGWWFWIAAFSNYVLVLGGAFMFFEALRRSPRPFKGQWLTLIAAAVIPLAGNAAYIFGMTTAGLDPTPVSFTASGLLFLRALHSERLFDLVPVARDTVVESLGDAVIVLNASKRVLDMNAAARRIAGVVDGWVGRPIETLMPILSDLRLDVVTDASTTQVQQRVEGDERYHDVRVIRVRTCRARMAAWVVVLRDITEQVRAEAERVALAARVQEQQKRESLTVLAGGLAHDFNNLLTGIVGNADLLSLHIPPSSDLGHNVGAILLGAQRAADLVDKMLAYAGERHGPIERVDLNVLVGDMVQLMRASAARHCTLEYEGVTAVAEVDPTQVRQVVMNLIINAADALERNGRSRVQVGAQVLTDADLVVVQHADDAAPGEYAYVDVQDNGPGIDEATLRRIFQPFFTTKPSGHGLGLAAVQGIVHGHRGALRVRSARGEGTAFRVWLPLAVTPVGSAPRPPSARSRTSAPPRTR